MSELTQPNSIFDCAWEHVIAAHKHNSNMKALVGYKELSEREGPDQKHYLAMYEHLRNRVTETELTFLDAKYEWKRITRGET